MINFFKRFYGYGLVCLAALLLPFSGFAIDVDGYDDDGGSCNICKASEPYDTDAVSQNNSLYAIANRYIQKTVTDDINNFFTVLFSSNDEKLQGILKNYADEVPSANSTARSIQTKAPMFNFNTILGQINIDGKGDKKAQYQKTVNFITATASPPPLLDASMIQFNTPAINAYQVGIAKYIVANSMAATTLQTALNQRITDESLKIKGKNGNQEVSPLGVDYYEATRRLESGTDSWIQKIATEKKSIVVEKENAFLLAEIRNEMFYQRMAQEQTNVLLAIFIAEMQDTTMKQYLSLQYTAAVGSVSQSGI